METCSTSTEEAGGLWGPQQGADSETQSSVRTQNITTTSATVNNWLINNIKTAETKPPKIGMHKKCAALSWASMRFSFPQVFHNHQSMTSWQGRTTKCLCSGTETYRRRKRERQTTHICYWLAGKQEAETTVKHCGDAVWRRRRKSISDSFWWSAIHSNI